MSEDMIEKLEAYGFTYHKPRGFWVHITFPPHVDGYVELPNDNIEDIIALGTHDVDETCFDELDPDLYNLRQLDEYASVLYELTDIDTRPRIRALVKGYLGFIGSHAFDPLELVRNAERAVWLESRWRSELYQAWLDEQLDHARDKQDLYDRLRPYIDAERIYDLIDSQSVIVHTGSSIAAVRTEE